MALGGSNDGREDDPILRGGEADPPSSEVPWRRRHCRGRRGAPAADEDPPLLDNVAPDLALFRVL
jgi:hypothetical protein